MIFRNGLQVATKLKPAIYAVLFILVGLSRGTSSADEAPIKVSPVSGDSSAFKATPDNTVEIRGPLSIRLSASGPLKPSDVAWVLEWDYFSIGGVKRVTATSGSSNDRKRAKSFPEMLHRETFGPYVVRLDRAIQAAFASSKDVQVALDMPADGVLQIRNARLRPEKAGEFDAVDAESDYAADPNELESYLSTNFVSKVSKVIVGEQEITISGNVVGVPEGSRVYLRHFPMESILQSSPIAGSIADSTIIDLTMRSTGDFSVTVPRVADSNGVVVDRLFSRWQLSRQSAEGDVAISHARYADEVACRSPSLAPAKVVSKKGLGGWSLRREGEALNDELQSLGISAVTVNVSAIHHFVSLAPGLNTRPMVWQGRTYYVDERRLEKYDAIFREAQKEGVMVSAILLVSTAAKSEKPDPELALLSHPDADPAGTFAMPNVTTSEGIAFYGAIMNLMAERWSREDGAYGRVHHWILHNEIDFGWVWTNAGRKADIAYMDLYQRSMRLVDLIARQYDPNSRAFMSLTHHWADQGNRDGYGSKRMLDLLVRFCEAEGDFPWALAYHPYPQNLFNPRTWEDNQATFDFETPKITPKNLEVLDAYMKLPRLRYQGKVRSVHLSENGFNSKDYSAKSLEDQAAGMALAWKKISQLSSIESWQYHNWIDNRHEGGLRIGLRRFPDDTEEPLGKKPIWHLYQALGTAQEDVVVNRYLKTIGIDSWNAIIHKHAVQ
jgi:hypothetical protein